MTDLPHHDHEVDRIARRLHAEAVAMVAARTLSQLRAGRAHALPAPRSAARPILGWTVAAVCGAVFAVAIGLSPGLYSPGAGEPRPLAADATGTGSTDNPYDEAIAALEEDPDFYLWLASTDVQPLAME